MKKPLIIAVAVSLAIVGGFAYLMLQEEAEAPSVTSPTSQPTDQNVAANAGQYLDYQESLIASTPGTKVLFFHAPWCPQCRQLESEIEAGPLPADTTIFKVDYDTNQALRQKYGVTLQTTLVKVDDQGNLVEKYTAYEDPTLDALKQNIL